MSDIMIWFVISPFRRFIVGKTWKLTFIGEDVKTCHVMVLRQEYHHLSERFITALRIKTPFPGQSACRWCSLSTSSPSMFSQLEPDWFIDVILMSIQLEQISLLGTTYLAAQLSHQINYKHRDQKYLRWLRPAPLYRLVTTSPSGLGTEQITSQFWHRNPIEILISVTLVNEVWISDDGGNFILKFYTFLYTYFYI